MGIERSIDAVGHAASEPFERLVAKVVGLGRPFEDEVRPEPLNFRPHLHGDLGLPPVHLVLVGAACRLVLEGLAASVAFEKLLVRVEKDMSVHARRVFEHLMAHFALVDKVVLGVHGACVVDNGSVGLEDFSAL